MVGETRDGNTSRRTAGAKRIREKNSTLAQQKKHKTGMSKKKKKTRKTGLEKGLEKNNHGRMS